MHFSWAFLGLSMKSLYMKGYCMKKIIFFNVLLLVSSMSLRAKQIEDFVDAYLSDMEQDMQASFKHNREVLKKMVAKERFPEIDATCGKVAITEDEKTITVVVPAPGLKNVDEISIVIEDGVARVSVPLKDGEFKAAIDEHMLDVSARCLIEQKEKQSDGKQVVVDQRSSEYATMESLPARIDVASIKPQYDEKSKTLQIVFTKKEAKKVPVTVAHIATAVKEQKKQPRVSKREPISASLAETDEK